MRHFFKESIKLLVFALIIASLIFVVFGYTLTNYLDNVQIKYNKKTDNNKAKACLGRKLSEKLYRIETNLTYAINSENNEEIDTKTRHNEDLTRQMSRIIYVLGNGGIYREKLSVNTVNKDDVVETIPYTKPNSYYIIEVIELEPRIVEIKRNTAEIIKLIKNNNSNTDTLSKNIREREIKLFSKLIETHFKRTHELINNIYHDVKVETSKLELEKNNKTRFLSNAKNTTFVFALLVGITLAYFIVKRILFLLREQEDNLNKIKEGNKDLLLSKAEVTQQLKTISDDRRLLKEQNKRLENFAYITSHDLQEPLNTIIGFSGILKTKFKAELGSFGLKSIEKIQKSSMRMKTLINELLIYSRLGESEQIERGEICSLMAEIQEDLADTILKNKVTFVYKDLVVMYGYKREMKSLLLNLITNAIKYRKEDESPVITINSKETKDYYHFSVADNGIGFNMQHKDKIFDIFQRLHTRDQYAGTGIGLATCKRIVELHKGEIWVESEEGKGSTFFFTIYKHLKND